MGFSARGGILKMNIDAGCSANRVKTNLGMVVRDDKGHLILGKSATVEGYLNVPAAEASTLLNGLRCARENGLSGFY